MRAERVILALLLVMNFVQSCTDVARLFGGHT